MIENQMQCTVRHQKSIIAFILISIITCSLIYIGKGYSKAFLIYDFMIIPDFLEEIYDGRIGYLDWDLTIPLLCSTFAKIILLLSFFIKQFKLKFQLETIGVILFWIFLITIIIFISDRFFLRLLIPFALSNVILTGLLFYKKFKYSRN